MQPIIIRPKKPLSSFTNIPELNQMRINAKGRNDFEYAALIGQRIQEIQRENSTEMESRFQSLIEIYEIFLEEKKNKKTRATRTRIKWKKDGTVKTATDLIKKKTSLGFSVLREVKKLSYSIEQFVIDYAAHFDQDTIQRARIKLAN